MRTLLIFALLAGTLAAQAPDLIAEGNKALDENRFAAAAELFSKAAAANPKDVSAHFNLALAYNLLDKDAEAIPEYRKVLELDATVYEAHVNLGQSLLRVKDAAGAIPHLRRAAAEKPREFRPSYYLAEALLETGEAAEAVNSYMNALSIDPNSASAELGLGRALLRLDRRSDSEPHLRKAAELDPRLRGQLLELATQYELHGEADRAKALYREFPDDPLVLEHLGILALNTGDFQGAVNSLEKAVRILPTPANRIALAQAYVKQKELAKAEPLLAEAAAGEPQDFDLRMFYGRVLRDARKFPDAAREFQAATRLKAEAVEAWSELSGMLILAEQYPAALDALDRVRKLGGENAGHLFFRATTEDRMRMKKEAVESYNKFLEASAGKNADQEFQARQRIRALEREMGKR